jgi:Mrp family chromosome partitioning ATPase
VLLVARAGVTSMDSLAIAMAHLRQAGAEVTGVVLNDIDFERDASYDSEYREFRRYAAYYVDVNGVEVN